MFDNYKQADKFGLDAEIIKPPVKSKPQQKIAQVVVEKP